MASTFEVACGECEVHHDQLACPNCGERANATREVGWTNGWDGAGFDPVTGGPLEVGWSAR